MRSLYRSRPTDGMLLVDEDSNEPLLVTPEGHPIWSVHSSSEHTALVRFADTFCVRLQRVHGLPGVSRPGREAVVGIGSDVEEAARLYAHLTRRRVIQVDRARDVPHGAHPAVVVTTPDNLSADLLARLYRHSTARAPGIVCATPEGLRAQVLIRAAAAAVTGPVTKGLALWPTLPGGPSRNRVWTMLGKTAEPSKVLKALQRGAGVVTIFAHSDGVDAFLGSDLVMCPMDRPASGIQRANRCTETQVCHRMRVPLSDALASGTLVPPEAVKAWLLVWGACWGVMPAGSVVDPKAGLAVRFASSPRLGAILTPWEILPIDPALLEYLGNLLLAGLSAGEALGRLLRSQVARRTNLRLCLLGDPRVRVASRTIGRRERLAAPPVASRRLERRRPEIETKLADIEFLFAYFEEDALQAPTGLAELSATALAVLRRYGDAIRAGHPTEGLCRAVGPEMRRIVLDYLWRRGPRILDTWSSLASLKTRRNTPTRKCFACRRAENAFTSYTATLELRCLVRRRVSICPICGVIEDAPLDSDVRLSLKPSQTVQLRYHRAFREPWAGVLVVRAQLTSERMSWHWPARPDNGMPARFFSPHEPWPTGPLDVGAILLRGASVIVVAQRGRR